MDITQKGPYKFESTDICKNCRGDGAIEMLNTKTKCPVCAGTGRVKVTKIINITIEPLKIENDDTNK